MKQISMYHHPFLLYFNDKYYNINKNSSLVKLMIKLIFILK